MNEIPLFSTTTLYDNAAYSALVNLMMRKIYRLPRYFVMLTGLLSIVLCGYRLFVAGPSAIVVFFLVLGNLFTLLGIFAPRFVVRLLCVQSREPFRIQYEFYEHEMHMITTVEKKVCAYSSIRRIIEWQSFWFFFLNNGQVYLLRPDAAPNNASLRTFINQKLAKGQ